MLYTNTKTTRTIKQHNNGQVNLQSCSPNCFGFDCQVKSNVHSAFLKKTFYCFNNLKFPQTFFQTIGRVLLYQSASVLSNLQNMHFWTCGNYISEICSAKNHPRMTEAGRGKGLEELSAKSVQWPITQVWPLWLLATASPVSHARSRCFYYCRGHW